MYLLKYQTEVAIIWIHVDDGEICASSIGIINHIQKALELSFEMVWQDDINQILGLEIQNQGDGIFLSQPLRQSLTTMTS